MRPWQADLGAAGRAALSCRSSTRPFGGLASRSVCALGSVCPLGFGVRYTVVLLMAGRVVVSDDMERPRFPSASAFTPDGDMFPRTSKVLLIASLMEKQIFSLFSDRGLVTSVGRKFLLGEDGSESL